MRCRNLPVVQTRDARPDPDADEAGPCWGVDSQHDWPYGVDPRRERRDGVLLPTELPWVDCGPLGVKRGAAISS